MVQHRNGAQIRGKFLRGNSGNSHSHLRSFPLVSIPLCTFTAVPKQTQPSTLRGTVKRVSAYGLSNNNNGDGGCGW